MAAKYICSFVIRTTTIRKNYETPITRILWSSIKILQHCAEATEFRMSIVESRRDKDMGRSNESRAKDYYSLGSDNDKSNVRFEPMKSVALSCQPFKCHLSNMCQKSRRRLTIVTNAVITETFSHYWYEESRRVASKLALHSMRRERNLDFCVHHFTDSRNRKSL